VTAYDDAVLALGPQAFWRCDELSGLSLEDATGHGHLISFTGSPQGYAIPGPSPENIPTGFYLSTSMGVPTCIDNVAGNFAAGQDFSIEAWMGSVGVSSTNNGIYGKGIGLTEVRPWYEIGYTNGGQTFFWMRNAAGTDYKCQGPALVSDATLQNRGPWHHVVGTFAHATGTQTLYVDGSPITSMSGTPDTGWGTGSQGVTIGVFNGTRNGCWVSRLALYPFVLDANQISDNFGSGTKCSAQYLWQLNTILCQLQNFIQGKPCT
jgi:hypothetical protein